MSHIKAIVHDVHILTVLSVHCCSRWVGKSDIQALSDVPIGARDDLLHMPFHLGASGD